ncbi:MAG: FtsX-like permease family protein [Chloroflexia bacterium]|nr:FtsX-like permease family protein [Chloroflexia bacterium]
MNDIFGLSMNIILVVLLALLGLCLLSVACIAWRRPVIFKLGVRNIPRRRAQTTLIILGLMLSTLLISAALGVGDTIDHSTTADVYDTLGQVDELIVISQGGEPSLELIAERRFDAQILDEIETAVGDNPAIDGYLPLLDARGAAVHPVNSLAEPDVVLTGLDPQRLEDFGGLRTVNGDTVDFAGFAANDVAISDGLADALEAKTGDQLILFVNGEPSEWTVAAVIEDTYLGGTRRGTLSGLLTPGLAMPLANLQALTAQPDQLSAIAVSNAGGVRDSLAGTEAAEAALSPALADSGLGVYTIKRLGVDLAKEFASFMTGLFLILGLFSIAAGILLIILIFTMLASERRSEMGMERAVGAQRRQLIQQFIAEGAGYALLAGLVGSALGVLASIGLAQGMKAVFGVYAPIEPFVSPRSMLAAYCLGVVITFLTICVASWRVSRLNIVAAVRDIPDVSTPKRKKRTLLWATLLLLAGGGLTLLGVDTSQAWSFSMGMSLWPFGVAMILRYFGVPGRPIFTIIGAAMLFFWLMPDNLFEAIFGRYDGDFEMFFISGIFMVTAATILIVNNLTLLLAGVSLLGGVFQSRLPAIRTAIAYPSAARGRTGLTIAMFSLIVFSLVMMATMQKNFASLFLSDEANAGWDVRADSFSGEPLADFTGRLEQEGVETSDFTATGAVHSASAGLSPLRPLQDPDPEIVQYPVRGMDAGFVTESEITFTHRGRDYATDAAVIEALQSEPDVAIIDGFALEQNNENSPFDVVLRGIDSGETFFDPVTVELISPQDGTAHPVKIIGVIDLTISSLLGLYVPEATFATVYDEAAFSSYFVSLTNPERADDVAKVIESALIADAVQGHAIVDELKEAQSQFSGFLYLIEGFMGLGLLVGIAAVGVIAFRSVVERRQQIGVLRAIGFARSLVALSFMIETAFIVVLGVVAGTSLGIILAYQLFSGEQIIEGGTTSNFAFSVPWVLVSVVVILTIAAALLMTWIPARQASRIAPAEALRYE